MQVGKRWECSGSESVELISEYLNLFGLLLGDIEELALVSNLLDLLGWVSVTIVHGVGFQTHDLLTLVNVTLQLTSRSLQLFAFHLLFFDLFLELESGFIDGPDSLLSVFLKLLNLVLEPLLVFLIFLLMLTLDDFLSLFCNSVQLHILGSLLEVLDFQVKSLLYIANSFQSSLELTDGVHQFDFFVTSPLDLFVFVIDDIF